MARLSYTKKKKKEGGEENRREGLSRNQNRVKIYTKKGEKPCLQGGKKEGNNEGKLFERKRKKRIWNRWKKNKTHFLPLKPKKSQGASGVPKKGGWMKKQGIQVGKIKQEHTKPY